jgi:hypothetical protein
MSKLFLIRKYEVVEFQSIVKAENEEEAWEKESEEKDTELVNDGNPVNYISCNLEHPDEIEEIKEGDDA